MIKSKSIAPELRGLTLVIVTGAWLAGILLAYWIPLTSLLLLIAAIVTLLCLIFFWSNVQARLFMLFTLGLLLGAWRYTAASPLGDARAISASIGIGTLEIRGNVSDEPKLEGKIRVLLVAVSAISKNGGASWQNAHGQVEVEALGSAVEDPYGANYGDNVELRRKLQAPLPQATPDIFASMIFPRISVSGTGGNPVIAALYHLRFTLATVISRSLPQPEAALLTAIVLPVVCGRGGKGGRMKAKEAWEPMTKRIEVASAPAPLEEYAKHFDGIFGKSNQREGFRRYVEGLLLPSERHKTLTGLTNTEPVVGAQFPRAQRLQWFLSESDWSERKVQAERLRLLREDPATAPTAQGVLVIDETGDRKDGHSTAHVSRQYLANLGKIDNGVVSVSSLWADERVYYPVDVEPYTPAVYFARGKQDPQFRTKLKIALQLVERALQEVIPFRAVVADSFYGEDRALRRGLRKLSVPYVLALKPSHAWWHPEDVAGTLQDVAHEVGWVSAERPGQWVQITRTFRDGSTQNWWALEIVAGPYGPGKTERAIVATTDPLTLPDASTWYLVTNLPAPADRLGSDLPFPPASLEEVLRLYGLRMWVEQSYKQVKHALGWSQYQVRSDKAIRRHWQLVCCAFSFCWYHVSHPEALTSQAATEPSEPHTSPHTSVPAASAGTGKRSSTAGVVADGAAGGTRMVGALDHAQALLAWLVSTAPASCVAVPSRMA